jgi:hypothetical protein
MDVRGKILAGLLPLLLLAASLHVMFIPPEVNAADESPYSRPQLTPLPEPQRPALPPPPAPAPAPSYKSRGAVNPKTGEYFPPSGKGVINPKTGEYFPPSGEGYINPKTGEYYPSK